MINYKYFLISDVFNYCRGKRLIKLNQEDGDIAYISSTKFNNGVDNYIAPPSYMKVYKNCITIANSGSVGYAFYHDYEFVASDHVTVLWLKDRELNKKIAMYLITLLKALKENYFFNREMSDKRIQKDYIKLPINDDESIAWDYIESYIDSMVPEINWKQRNLKATKENISIKNTKDYPITEIFKVRGVRGKINQQQLKEGDYIYVTTSNKNFGFKGFHNEYSEEGNVFTVDSATDGKCFYQKDKFIGSDHVEILEVKDKYKKYINKYTVVYLQTLLNYYLDKYEYSRKRAQVRIKKEYINLPIDTNNDIDWNTMENYIKSLSYSEFL